LRTNCIGEAGVGVLVVLLAPGVLLAQSDPKPVPITPVKSLGQPWRYKPYMSGAFSLNGGEDSGNGGLATLGTYKDLTFPMVPLLGMNLEGYLGAAGGRFDGGGRFMLTSRLFFLGAGVDYNARLEKANFILSVNPQLRRGGLFGLGGSFRLDWIPGRGNSLNFGYTIPLEPRMGKTRPVKIGAELPKPPRKPPVPAPLPAEAEEALEHIRRSSQSLIAYTHAFDDDSDKDYASTIASFRKRLQTFRESMEAKDERHPDGHTYRMERTHYNDELDRAFTVASGTAGRQVSDLARQVILDDVLLPYDRLIGQYDRPNTILGLAARGRVRLAGLLKENGLEARSAAVLTVFDRWAAMVEERRKRIEANWEGDERKAWLPLQLGLRPEEYDTQAKLDAFIARAMRRPFERGNAIFPMNSSRFSIELMRSLEAARSYHVLWIHDYAGETDGEPDPIAYRATVEGYLKAMTARVREYDETGVLPTFIVFHTEWFYEANNCRFFLTLLEDPLARSLKFKPKFGEMDAGLRAAQEELQRAVAASQRLQALKQERGEKYIHEIVKVHVNITYPADLSFRSSKLVSHLKLAPDSVMLDHRKLFFYDVTEEDPRKGAAGFTGTGVGVVYSSPTWEDRGLLVTGPALLELKAAARRVLKANAMKEENIPPPLRPRAKPSNYETLVDELEAQGHRAHGLNAHNEVGFATKEATFLQSMLYTLVPRDTLIVSPDAIWTNPYWAGLLVGAAVRGCHVYIVAPSYDNSPAPSPFVMSRTREIFTRLLEARSVLGPLIKAAGGQIRVGLYTREAPSGDTLAKLREVKRGLQKYPFLINEFPFPEATLSMLEEESAALEKSGYKPSAIAQGGRSGKPKMHRKTQLFVSRSALRALAHDPATIASLRSQLDAIAEATSNPSSILEAESPLGSVNDILRKMRDDPPPEAKDAVYYLTVGSKNQDPRSAFLDGETIFTVAGPSALWSYPDFLFLMAATTWVDSREEIDKLIPFTKEGTRKLSRIARRVL